VSDPQDTWHIYTIDWTKDYIKWYVDNNLVRTLLYADALDGKNFPQTPMQIKIGNWVGGAADEAVGTVEWAGGYTDLDDAPFTMYVKNITIEDYTSCATTYSYGDETGSYESIIVGGDNTISSSNGTCSSSASANKSTLSNSTSLNSSSSISTSSSATASSYSSLSTVAVTNDATSMPSMIGLTVVLLGLGFGLSSLEYLL
jgi:beta-glucanase (GH16 family)